MTRLFVIVFLAIQLAVPIGGLLMRGGFPFDPAGDLTDWPHGQLYFTWQMYSVSQTPATYTVIDDGGRQQEINPVARYGWLTGRAHYTADAARRLCREEPGTLEVRHAYRTVECDDG